MFNIFRRFKKLSEPVRITQLVHIPIRELVNLDVRVLYRGQAVDLTAVTLPDIVFEGVTMLVKDMSHTEFTINQYGNNALSFRADKFNKEVNEFSKENKLYGKLNRRGEYYYRDINRSLEVNETIDVIYTVNSIYDIANVIVKNYEERQKSFDELNEFVEKYQYLVPVVDSICLKKNDVWECVDNRVGFKTVEGAKRMIEYYREYWRILAEHEEAEKEARKKGKKIKPKYIEVD